MKLLGEQRKKGKVEKKHLSDFDLKNLEKRISELRVMMKQASRELRFEDAAKIRDEIKNLSEARLLPLIHKKEIYSNH